MTGYDEAVAWLQNNAPDWVLLRSDARLHAGLYVGAPTIRHYEIGLGRLMDARPEIILIGEGVSMVEAIENALGGLSA